MAFDEILAERVREVLAGRQGLQEKRMFGGTAFLVHGNICVGIHRQSLLARLGPEQAEAALRDPSVRPFDITGKPMRGWVLIEPEALEDDAHLRDWVDLAEQFVATLPAK